jgi:hypothetical protein
MSMPHLAVKGHRMKTCTTLLLAACWGVVVLSAVSASAGAGGNGIRLNGLSFNGLSQNGVGKSDGLRDSIAQGVTAPQAETPSAPIPRQVELADPALASTAAKREQLTYLVRCALPADIALYTQQGTERFTFQGSMGLAPRWLYEAMTPSEERWVSACLLALVNYFGKHVRVSMRATPPPVPALESSDDEQQTFSIFEGGFFDNLFTPEPVAYTCRGERTPAQASDPILQDRICTRATGETTADGKSITSCRFLLTGRCEDATSFTVDGTQYAEVIFTYLRPGQHE